LAIDGQNIYIADGDSGLQRYDIIVQDFTGTVDTPGEARGVHIDGDLAYVADSESGLQVVNLTSFTIVNSVDTPGHARGTAVAGGYAYVADGGSGLQIIDLSEMSIVGSVLLPGSADDVVLRRHYAHVCSDGLQIIDISSPSHPTLTTSVEMPPSTSWGLSGAGQYDYVAVAGAGFQVVDISDPDYPIHVGGRDTPGEVFGVTFKGNYVYLAAGGAGLQICLQQCGAATPVTESIPSRLATFDIYPNPFNPKTIVQFSLEKTQAVKLSVHDLVGRYVARLADGIYTNGIHSVEWDGRDLSGKPVSSGTYIIRMETIGRTESRKAMLIR